MLVRIKQYAWGACAAIVAILLAVVYYFFSRTKSLSSKNSQLEGDIAVKDQLYKLADANKEDEDAEDSYKRTRDAYVSESLGDGSRDGK